MKRNQPDRPDRPARPPVQPCLIAWCQARHATEVRDLRFKTHTADLATSTAQGERLKVRLTQSADLHGTATDAPTILLVVTQEDTRSEPVPPAVLRLDERQARDWARVLTATTGQTWLAETLRRAVRLLEAERAGAGR